MLGNNRSNNVFAFWNKCCQHCTCCLLLDIYSFQMGSEVLLDVKKNAHYYNVQFIDAFVILSLSNWDLMQLNIF